MDGLLGSLGGRLSQRLLSSTVQALLFVGCAAAALSYGDGGHLVGRALGWVGRQDPLAQTLVVAAALGGSLVAGLAVDRLARPVLRLLAGYWPGWLAPVRSRLVRRARDRAAADNRRVQRLLGDGDGGFEYQRLDRRLRDLPSTPDRYQPSRLGNIMCAARTRPVDRYGIDPVAVWPHLYLVVPDPARRELTTAGLAVDRAAAAFLWSLVFVALTPWAWWAAPVGILAATLVARMALPAAARTHGDLLEAAVDLYRLDLYERLRWPLPECPADERALGEQLVSYLVYGSDARSPRFRPAASGPQEP